MAVVDEAEHEADDVDEDNDEEHKRREKPGPLVDGDLYTSSNKSTMVGGWTPKSVMSFSRRNTPDSLHGMVSSWFAKGRGSAPVVPLDDPDIDLEHGHLNHIPDESKAAHEDRASLIGHLNASGDSGSIHANGAMAEDRPWEIPLSPFPGVIDERFLAASDRDLTSLAGGGGANADDLDVESSYRRVLRTSNFSRKGSIGHLLTESFKQALQLTSKTSKESTHSKNNRRLTPLQVNLLFSFSF